MEATEARRREGFQRTEAPPRSNGGPQDFQPPDPPPPRPAPPVSEGQGPPQDPLSPGESQPQPPLPSQMKLDQPPPLEPLSEWDEARQQIREAATTWPIVVHLLYKPIRDNKGKEIWEISFREPKAADINRIGNPTRLLWDNEVVIEERKMTYIIAALSGIFPPMIEEMDPRDWNTCALRLRKFFLADLRGW